MMSKRKKLYKALAYFTNKTIQEFAVGVYAFDIKSALAILSLKFGDKNIYYLHDSNENKKIFNYNPVDKNIPSFEELNNSNFFENFKMIYNDDDFMKLYKVVILDSEDNTKCKKVEVYAKTADDARLKVNAIWSGYVIYSIYSDYDASKIR